MKLDNWVLTLVISLIYVGNIQAQWVKINGIPSNDIVAFANIGDTLYAASDTNFVYKSKDGGMSWNALQVSGLAMNISVIKSIGNTLCVGTYHHGIFISEDGGASWEQNGQQLPIVSGFTSYGGEIVTSTMGEGVFAFNRNTKEWLPMNDSLPTYSFNVNFILHTEQTLWIAAGANGTIYQWDTLSKSWIEEFYDGRLHPGLQIQQLNHHSDTLYAVNFNRIIRSDDNGLNWFNDMDGAPNGYSRTMYSGVLYDYTLTNITTGDTWLQKRNKDAAIGASWADQEELIPSGYCYDLFESHNKLFLGKSDGLYVKNLSTGIQAPQLNETNIQLFPNPMAGSVLHISSREKLLSIELSNSLGQVVTYKSNPGEQIVFEEVLPDGLYFIRLNLTHGEQVIKRLMVDNDLR